MEQPLSTLEVAELLQNTLLSHATGAAQEDDEYKALRLELMEQTDIAPLLPSFVRTCRDLRQFWSFIKAKFGSYQERREFIWGEFRPLLDHLEGRNRRPLDATISDGLRSFDAEGVQSAWTKALDRRTADPEGAITAARTLLETVCKHILDAREIDYARDTIELPELYRLTSRELNLSPSQHTQEVFKQVLGGVTSVVIGLGSLRNRLGDAHGKGRQPVRPSPRHAQLAVNLAGAAALFLIETWLVQRND